MSIDTFLKEVTSDTTRIERLTQAYREKLITGAHPMNAPRFTTEGQVHRFIDTRLTPRVSAIVGMQARPYHPYIDFLKPDAQADAAAQTYLDRFRTAIAQDENEAKRMRLRRNNSETDAIRTRFFDGGNVSWSNVLDRYSTAGHLAHEHAHHLIHCNRKRRKIIPYGAWEEGVCHAATLAVQDEFARRDERYAFYGNYFSWETLRNFQDGDRGDHAIGYTAACLLHDKHGSDAAKIILAKTKQER